MIPAVRAKQLEDISEDLSQIAKRISQDGQPYYVEFAGQQMPLLQLCHLDIAEDAKAFARIAHKLRTIYA